LFFGPGQLVIGAAGSKATRAAFTVRDFDAVHQGVAIFDLLGMIAGTERTCGLLPPDEVYTSDGTAGRLTTDRLTSATKGARLGDTARRQAYRGLFAEPAKRPRIVHTFRVREGVS
jgi:hypothetical protein